MWNLAGWSSIGTRVPDKFVETYSLPNETEIVLASDGGRAPKGTLDLAENELAKVLTADPLLIRLHLGFRPAMMDNNFNDRAWLRAIV